MQLFLVETVKLAPKRDQDSACLTTPIKIIQKRYKSMKDAATIVNEQVILSMIETA